MSDPTTEPPDSGNIKNGPSQGRQFHTIKGSAEALRLSKLLANHYGGTQGDVVQAALTLMQNHLEGVDVIQIPELMSSVADLEETVGRLIVQAEQLERLAYELAAFEADRVAG